GPIGTGRNVAAKIPAKTVAAVILLLLGFAVAMPSSAAWLATLVTGKGTTTLRVVSVTAEPVGVSVRFSQKVRATHNSFSLQCPVRHAHTFALTASPAQTFTLRTASKRLRIGS